MVRRNGASSVHGKEGRLSIEVDGMESGRTSDSLTSPERWALLGRGRSRESVEEAENLSRTALMDCYNG